MALSLIETKDLSVVEMNAEQAHKNVCSGPEPLVLFLSLLLYLGFELSFCSMDFPADITLRKTRMKFELTFKVVLLFSYQGFVCSFFCDTTSLFYLIQKFLSRTFFILLFLSFENSLYILSFSFKNVKYFFVINNHNGEEGI